MMLVYTTTLSASAASIEERIALCQRGRGGGPSTPSGAHAQIIVWNLSEPAREVVQGLSNVGVVVPSTLHRMVSARFKSGSAWA